MDTITIQNRHMTRRCWCIAFMMSCSLYTWIHYPHFSLVNNISSVYTLNCLFFLCYLFLDMYQMLTCKILFRKDLMVHHVITFMIYVNFIGVTPLQGSNCLIMEYISLMNSVWKENPQFLKLYRSLCIFCVRFPVCLYYILYWNQKLCLQNPYLCGKEKFFLFFIFYDLYILKQLYWKNNKKCFSSQTIQ
jgi:hypothetical protein